MTRRAAGRQPDIGRADYVAEMPVGQKAIYYLSGASREALQLAIRMATDARAKRVAEGEAA